MAHGTELRKGSGEDSDLLIPGTLLLITASVRHGGGGRLVHILELQWAFSWGFPDDPTGKEPNCQCRRPRFSPEVGKIHWRREWLPTPVFLPGKFHGQQSLVGYSPRGHKESDTTE